MKEGGGLSRDTFSTTGETQMLRGGGFYGYAVDGKTKIRCHVLNHRGNVREEFGSLCNYSDVDIYGGERPLLADYAQRFAQKVT